MNTQYNPSTPFLGQLFDAKFNKTRTKSNDPFSSSGFNNNYNMNNLSNVDCDNLREELLRIKSDFNKKNQEFHCLRIAYKKVETENQEITSLVEELLTEANKKLLSLAEEMISYSDEDFISKLSANISKETTSKLFSRYLMLKMKHEIVQLRDEIKRKDNEISSLKTSAKISKYQDLDNKYAQTSLELAEITEKYKFANQMQNEMQNQTQSLLLQLNDYHKEIKKQKLQLNKTQKEIIVHKQEQEKKTIEAVKSKEKKLENSFKLTSKQLKDKEREIFCLRQRLSEFEKKTMEIKSKEQNDKDAKVKDDSLKEEIKRKNMKIKELESKCLEYFAQLEQAKNKKQPMKPITKFEKEIIALKMENEKLNNEIKKLKEELQKYQGCQTILQANADSKDIEDEYNEFETKLNKEKEELSNENNNNNNQDNLFITGKINTKEKAQIIEAPKNELIDNKNNDEKVNDKQNEKQTIDANKVIAQKMEKHPKQIKEAKQKEKQIKEDSNQIDKQVSIKEQQMNQNELKNNKEETDNDEQYNDFEVEPSNTGTIEEKQNVILSFNEETNKQATDQQQNISSKAKQEKDNDNQIEKLQNFSNNKVIKPIIGDEQEEHLERNDQNQPLSTEEYHFSSKDKQNISHEQSDYFDEGNKLGENYNNENNKQFDINNEDQEGKLFLL